jgi:esterase/lipase superfamily enzyme
MVSSVKLADAYLEEDGTYFNPKAALALYKSAADRGDAYSEAKYATIALQSPSPDASMSRAEALSALRRSAARGQPEALITLASIAEASGDLDNAYAYATSASELGGQEYSASAQRIRLSVCAELVDPICEPVPVFYITNRQVTPDAPRVEFGNRLARDGELSMGHSLVSIPTAQVARADQRSLWEILRAYLLRGTERPESTAPETTAQGNQINSQLFDGELDAFLASVKEAGAENERDRAIIFIHGFANTFDDAVRRIALISESSKYPGIPIVLSLASAGQSGVNLSSASGYTGPGYTNDMLTIGQSCGDFQQVLEKVIDVFGSDNVTVFAHSMGSLLVDYMLSGCPNYPVAWSHDRKIGNLVLAAPDIDLDQFSKHIDAVRSAAKNLTIYVSANDLALRASQEAVGGRRRLGQGGAERFIADRVMTIDTTTVEVAGGLNHSYVFDVSQVKRDLSDLFRGNIDPNFRDCPKSFRDERAQLDYWVLQPNCTQ